MLRLARVLLLVVLCGACAAPRPTAPQAEREVRELVEALYAAFDFDAGGEADWDAQRALFLEGAAFAPPAARERRLIAQDAAGFLEEFRRFALEGPYAATGLHERVVGVRVEVFGGVAHAFVAFEGHRPGEAEALTRGLDSLALVRDGDAWRLLSFSTQYEDGELVVPERFLGER